MITTKNYTVRQACIFKPIGVPLLIAGFCILSMLPEAWAFPVTPTTLTYNASTSSPTPALGAPPGAHLG